MTRSLTFAILATETDVGKELRDVLSKSGRARVLISGDNAKQIQADTIRLRPDAVVITLDAKHEATLAMIGRIAAECPDTMIICASRDSSPDLILRSLRVGAREFLRLPITAEELETVLDRTAELAARSSKSHKKEGRAIAVFSSKGGCGVSFIAANLAAALNGPTVLVDLNLQAGDLDLFLGATPKFSIIDLVENYARLDEELLTGYLTTHSARLSLLPAPREADLAENVKPEHVTHLIQFLREHNDYVVIDPQHTFDAVTLAALDHVDDILLVVTLDIPAIRNAERALAIFDRLGYPRHKVHIVVNRYSKQIDMELQQVERYLGERVASFIPSDYRAAVNSINMGKLLIEAQPTSTVAEAIKRTAEIFMKGSSSNSSAPVEAEPRKRLLKSLFRRQAASDTGLSLRETLDKA